MSEGVFCSRHGTFQLDALRACLDSGLGSGSGLGLGSGSTSESEASDSSAARALRYATLARRLNLVSALWAGPSTVIGR